MNQLARILQVEDSPEDRMMTAEALYETPVSVDLRAVATAREAMAVLSFNKEWCPSVVLLDLSLPGETGHSLLQFIKSESDLQHIPVVIFSSSTKSTDISTAYSLGAEWYIPKPPDFDGYIPLMASLVEFSSNGVKPPFSC